MSRVCQPASSKGGANKKTLLVIEGDNDNANNTSNNTSDDDSSTSTEDEQTQQISFAAQQQASHMNDDGMDICDSSNTKLVNSFHLPADIVYTVFLFASRSDLLKVHSLVCKEWYRIAHLKQLWWFHTLVQNPYYFEQSTALMWQQNRNMMMTSSGSSSSLVQLQQQASSFNSSLPSPNTPIVQHQHQQLPFFNPSASMPFSSTTSSSSSLSNALQNNNMMFNFSSAAEPNTPVSPAAQVFQFKHYFAAESSSLNNNTNNNRRAASSAAADLLPVAPSRKQSRTQFLMAVDDMPKRRKRSLQALQTYNNANGEQVDDSMLVNASSSNASNSSSSASSPTSTNSSSSSSLNNDHTMTMLLDCRGYYLEQALVKKFTTCTLAPANSSANLHYYQLQQVQPAITPTSANTNNNATNNFNFPTTPSTPVTPMTAGAGAPAITPLPNANNNNAAPQYHAFPTTPLQQQQQSDQVPDTPTRNFLRNLASRFSFGMGGSSSSTPSSPAKSSNPFGNVPLIQADTNLESMLVANGPGKRFRHTMTAITVEGKECLYIIGGMRQRSAPQPTGAATAAAAAAAVDSGEDVVFRIEFANDNSSVSCTRVPVIGKPPHLAKHSACAYYAPIDHFSFGNNGKNNTTSRPQIILFGGAENETVTNNCYVYDIHSSTFEKLDFSSQEQEQKMQQKFNPFQAPSVPTPRTNHSAAIIGNEMYIVAGGIGQTMTPTSEIWVLNLLTRRWRLITNINNAQVFTPRLGCAMTVLNNKLVIYGGGYWKYVSPTQQCWGAKYQDLFIYDTESCTFTRIEAKGNERPSTGTFPASALCGAHWFIMGGAFEQKISNEIYMLDLVTFTWKRVNNNFYGADSLHACVIQNKLVTFGGFCYQPLNSACVLKLNYMDIMQRFNAQSLKKCINNVAL